MRLRHILAVSGMLLALTTLGAAAQSDPAQGQALAREWCARCHDVEKDGPFKQHPPSFTSISIFRSENQIYGRILFPPLHSAMPEMIYILNQDNMKDILAYILSLEPND